MHFDYLPRDCKPFSAYHEDMGTVPKYGLWQVKVLGDWPLTGVHEVRLHFKVLARPLSSQSHAGQTEADFELAQDPGLGCNDPSPSTTTSEQQQEAQQEHMIYSILYIVYSM